MKKRIYYFSGTHWDREWYITFQEFRLKLVRLVDSLLELLESDPDFGVFHFDGQTIVLDDYLEIQPENRSRLEKQIRSGRILIGPWYCMPDEFLVSGESIIRNMIIGQEICHSFGTTPWKVGYVPDIFGHIAQLPQIMKGFGIDYCMLARGIDENTPTFFRWQAPSGDEVITYRFPREEGYGSFCLQVTGRMTAGMERTSDSDDFLSAAFTYLNRELSRTNAQAVVAADAMDHEPPHRYTSAYIKKIKELYPDCEVYHTDLRQMFEEVKPYSADFPLIAGELAHTSKDGGMPMITHTLSSRISLKQRNNRCETLLEKQLEPILVYAQTKGIAFPAGFRKTAWKHLLQNHPHDSICGCSCDTVHQDMQYRFSQAEMLAKGLLTEIWDKLVGKRHIIEAEGGFINLFNPSPTKRQEGIEITLPFKPNFPKYKEPFGYEEINRFRIFTQQGEEIYYTIKKMETNKVFLLYGETWEKVDYYTIVLETELQPFGFTALKLLPDDRPVRFFGEGLYHNGRLENKYLSVDINSDGTINLFDKSTNRRYEKLLELWDDTEIGDGWNSVRPKVASVITSGTLKGIEVLTNSPYFAEICLHREYVIPQNILHTNSSFERNTTAVSLPIDIKLSISSNSQSVNVCMNIENKACDHRLRLILPTGCIGNNYQVNQSFTFLNRTVKLNKKTENWIEAERMEKNMRGVAFKKDSDGIGLAFVGKYGFYECAAENDNIIVTLFRSFGKVYYDDNLVDSQEQGIHSFVFSLVPLSANIDAVYLQQKQDLLQTEIFSVCNNQPMSDSLLHVRGAICISAIKPAENDSNSIILRVFNPSETSANAQIQIDLPIQSVVYCDLLENVQSNCPLTDNHAIFLTLGPGQIQTLKIQLS